MMCGSVLAVVCLAAAAAATAAALNDCSFLEFACSEPGGGPKCVPSRYKCDGDNDCEDGSDEAQCRCPSGRFRCPNRRPLRCIPERYRCDGDDDCGDNSDEQNCECPPDQFTCRSSLKRRCIPKRFVCDEDDDCGDNSDEESCESVTQSPFIASECGQAGSSPSTDNSSVVPGQWPWLVSIRRLSDDFEMDHTCGGVLVAPDAILTAKHCVYTSRQLSALASIATVHQNSHDSDAISANESVASVAGIFAIVDSDLALVKLRRKIAPASSVICLPETEGSDVPRGELDECWFSGWGSCGYYGDFAGPPTQTRVDVEDRRDIRCLSAFPTTVRDGSSFCVRPQRPDRPLCFGDSGGPLMCRSPGGQWRVQGILSAGKGPCAAETRAVFESIPKFRKWILRQLALPSYRAYARSPIPLVPETPGVGFRAACVGDGEESFQACVLPNGAELSNGTVYTSGGFVYMCKLTDKVGELIPLACSVDGKRLEPGNNFTNQSFAVQCVIEEDSQSRWMRTIITGCWDNKLNQNVPTGASFEATDGGKLKCFVSYDGDEAWVKTLAGVPKEHMSSTYSMMRHRASVREL